MRTLSDSKIMLAIGASYFGCMPSVPFMSCYNNQKIFNSVMLFILNRTQWIFSSFMVNQFPFMKTSSQMFSHYKAVLKNITLFICHSIKEIISGNPNLNVTTCGNLSATLPSRACRTRPIALVRSFTRYTSQTFRHSMFYYDPSLFTTINASCPCILIHPRLNTIMSIWVYLFCSSNFPYLWHNLIIAQPNNIRKEEDN